METDTNGDSTIADIDAITDNSMQDIDLLNDECNSEQICMENISIDLSTDGFSDRISFVLKNSPIELTNGLRRVLLSDVPTFAVHSIIMQENTTIYDDRFIAHRVAMLPIYIRGTKSCNPVDVADWVNNISLNVSCTICNGLEPFCDHCSFQFLFHYDGCRLEQSEYLQPKQSSNEFVNISYEQMCEQKEVELTSQHFQLLTKQSDEFYTSFQYKTEVPFVTVRPNDKLHFTAIVTKGCHREHAKWAAVSSVGYKILPQFTIDNVAIMSSQTKHKNNNFKQSTSVSLITPKPIDDIENLSTIIAESCSMNVYESNSENGDLTVVNPWNCTLCGRCIQAAPASSIRIDSTKNKDRAVRLEIETIGNLHPLTVMILALNILKKKIIIANEQMNMQLNK